MAAMAADERPSREPREIEDRIAAFIKGELLSPDMSLGQNDQLLEEGLLDSIAVLRLAAFVEEEFQFKMQPADFVIENFQTIAVLAEYVRRATDSAGGSPAGSAR
jgi:acyl carrier protein